jgi:hypothetical protein
MKRILSAATALLLSASMAAATCSTFVNAGSGQNLVNYCDYAVIVEWRSTHGGCSTGGRCSAVVGPNSAVATSNPYGSGWNLWECVYDDWVNGICQF